MVKVRRTYDVKEAEAILIHPAIWATIASPSQDVASFTLVDKRSHIHILGYVGDTVIGLSILHPNIRKEYYCHVHVLPQYRKKFSKEFGNAALAWAWDNTPITTINALIPDQFSNVTKFAEINNFTKKEFIFVNKNGQQEGNWLLQIHKEDFV